jgi:hypothetical protein
MLEQVPPAMLAGAKPLGALVQPYPHEYTREPSGWVMKAGCAVRLKVGPVIPGVAANAVPVSSSRTTATIGARNSRVIEFVFFMFVALMAALLIDVHFGH